MQLRRFLALIPTLAPAAAMASDPACYTPNPALSHMAESASNAGPMYPLCMGGPGEPLNEWLFSLINAGADRWTITVDLALFAATWVAVLAALWIVWRWVRGAEPVRRALLDAVASGLLGLTAVQVISTLWYHPRPFEFRLGRQLMDHAPEASFPSDHATLIFALAFSMAFTPALRRASAPMFALGLLVSWARVYLGVHWPLDMVGGLALGLAAALTIRAFGAILHRWPYDTVLRLYRATLDVLRLPAAIFPR